MRVVESKPEHVLVEMMSGEVVELTSASLDGGRVVGRLDGRRRVAVDIAAVARWCCANERKVAGVYRRLQKKRGRGRPRG